MTIASEITRIKTNIENAYTKAEEKGATMPELLNSEGLAGCIESIPKGGGAGDDIENEVIPEGYLKKVFIDYDGTILSEQFVKRGESPVPPDVTPKYDFMQFTRWHIADNTNEHQMLGACYKIPDNTIIYRIKLDDTQLVQNFDIAYNFYSEVESSECNIDWGDGSIEEYELATEDVSNEKVNFLPVTHTYASSGEYFIKLYCKFTGASSSSTGSRHGGYGLAKVERFTPISNGKFYYVNSRVSYDVIEFPELIELFVNTHYMDNICDPFIPVNLENLLLADNQPVTLNNKFNSAPCNIFNIYSDTTIDAYKCFMTNNKIKHLTIPGNNDKDNRYTYRYNISMLSRMKYLETFVVGSVGYELKVSYCPNIKYIYNMTEQTSWGYPNWSATLSYLTGLKKIYNPVGIGTNIKYDTLPSLKKIDLAKQVSLSGMYNLEEINLNFYEKGYWSVTLSNFPMLKVVNGLDWSKISLNQTQGVPKGMPPNYTGVLDLSSSTETSLGPAITETSTGYNSYSFIWYNSYWNSIIFPETITSINAMFTSVYNIKHIDIPEHVQFIATKCSDCYKLKSFKVSENTVCPENLKLPSPMFDKCYDLEEVILPKNCNFDNAYSGGFSNCTNLKKIWLPASAKMGYFSSTSYSLIKSTCNKDVIIYTDATEKPDTWGSYWDYYDRDNRLKVYWGATKENYENGDPIPA